MKPRHKALFLLLFLFYSCGRSRPGFVSIDHTQSEYGNIKIIVYKENQLAKNPLKNEKIRVLLIARDFSLRTTQDGIVPLEIPVELRNKIDKVKVVVEGREFEIPYKKQKTIFSRDVRCEAFSYRRLKFIITQKKISQSPEDVALSLQGKLDFEGRVTFVFARNIEKDRHTGNGIIEFILEDADEIKKIVEHPEVMLKFEDGEVISRKLNFIPQTGKVELKNVIQNDNSFKGEFYNGTYFEKRVVIRAGYKKPNGEWFEGGILGTHFYSEEEVALMRGEKKSIEISYRKPLLGECELKYEINK